MDVTTPEQILRQAADAASVILPSLNEKRNRLLTALGDLDLQIAQMQTLLAAFPGASPGAAMTKAPESSTNSAVLDGFDMPPPATKKAPKGQLEERIKQVLSPMAATSAREIKESLDAKFGGDANRSSIHQTLHRGLKAGTFTYENNLWALNK